MYRLYYMKEPGCTLWLVSVDYNLGVLKFQKENNSLCLSFSNRSRCLVEATKIQKEFGLFLSIYGD